MSTTYTKVADISSSYTDVEDISTTHTKIADQETQNKPFGGLLKLATEGSRYPLVTEDESTYIVVSKGSDGIDYTKREDVTTTYTKISDV